LSAPLAGLRPSYLRVRGAPDPLAAFRALYGSERYGFLYESLSGTDAGRGRYSFLGSRPVLVLSGRDGVATLRGPGHEVHALDREPLVLLAELLASGVEALPVASFPGGAVGYLGYDVARRFLPLGTGPFDDLGWPDLCFLFPSEVVVIDHLDEVAHILVYGRTNRAARCNEIAKDLARNPRLDPTFAAAPSGPAVVRSNMNLPAFAARVERIRRHIREGDAYQVVLSRRFELEGVAPPLELYAALRCRNPSPYMYYLALDGLHLAGSSPETLVKLSGRRVTVRPLAGTRPRGGSEAADDAAALELLDDPKERAEHVMLVDLARNDIGRVCEAGSVAVRRLLEIERYASVMHLVSDVEGRLRDDRDGFDLTRACFPAGTVSGAPKIRAMQIVDGLEPTRRGAYAGAIGYFSFLGDLDLCIAIRTVVLHGGRAWLQAGAGIVADSDARREFEETASKAAGVLGALGTAAHLERRAAEVG
jgi:anthranilate synthase component 1